MKLFIKLSLKFKKKKERKKVKAVKLSLEEGVVAIYHKHPDVQNAFRIRI